MPAVEVQRVRVRSLVEEANPDAVALGGAQRRTGDLAVEGPGGEEDPRRDLDLAVHGDDLVLAQQRPIRARSLSVITAALALRKMAEVPRPQEGMGIEQGAVEGAHHSHVVAVPGVGRVARGGRRGLAAGAPGERSQPGAERAPAGPAEDRAA